MLGQNRFFPAGLPPCHAGVRQQMYATAQPCQTVDNSKEEMERAKGFEPSATIPEALDSKAYSRSDQSDYTQGRAHTIGASCPDLAKVVVSWEKLPAPLKSAILAIIKSAEVMP